jgi:hypothetical protein
MEKLEYDGHPGCIKLTNGTVEVVVTTASGPRLLFYGFVGGDNALGVAPDAAVDTEYGTWRAIGGHRLWHAPENNPRSYVPDDEPLDVEELGERWVRLVQPVEKQTGVQKEMTLALADEGTALTVEHVLTNHGPWGIDLAPWALTILNGEGGGTVILPQEPYKSHNEELLPARPMVLWHYTDLSDPRWQIGPRLLRLRVDATRPEPQKLGIADKQGWAAYARSGLLFVKRFGFDDTSVYPDEGSTCETYTAGSFVELETLAPVFHVLPGDYAEHTELWYLFDDVDLGTTEDAAVAALEPRIAETGPVGVVAEEPNE